MGLFFTSDSHFGHANILKYELATRPFVHVDDMDEALMKGWNSTIGPNDTVYHLGDLSFLNAKRTFDIVQKLNGNIHWIPGNHDSKLVREPAIARRFKTIQPLMEEKFTLSDGTVQLAVMCHFPMLVWNRSHHGSWMLHGHSRGNLKLPWPMRLMDVGVDTNNMKPYSLLEIEQYMADKTTTLHDHHQERT